MDVDKNTLPLQKDGQIETRPLYIEEWLETLPYTDFPRTSQRLHKTLLASSRVSLKPGVRGELLALYQQPYQYYLNAQISAGARHSLQSVERLQGQLQAMKQLAADLALTARLIVDETANQKTLWGQNRQPLAAAQQAITYLSQALIFSFLEYGPTPRHVWKQLNTLYRLAESLQQQHTPLSLSDGGSTSIARSYCRILLTDLADPYHLPFGGIWEIYEQLADWAEYAELRPITIVDDAHGRFVVDLDSDEPPCHYAKFDPLTAGAGHRLLDVRRVHALAQQHLDRSQAVGDPKLRLSPNLARLMLTQMARAWSLPPKRFFPREDISGEVHISCGLSPVHFHMNGGLDYLHALPDGLAVDGEPLVELTETTSNYALDAWQLVNHSPAGYALRKSGRPAYTVRVGDLIGLRLKEAVQPAPWQLGVIRWLKIYGGPDYRIGVQLVSGHVTPVALRAVSGSHAETEPRRAFRIVRDGAMVLISGTGLYRSGAELELITPGARERVQATELVEATPGFEQFTAQPL